MKSSVHNFLALASLVTHLLLPKTALSQVTLQSWLEVFGEEGWGKLGLEVSGIIPTSNLPYRIAVYDSGRTGLYALPALNNTTPALIIHGENLHVGDLNDDGWSDAVVRRLDNASHIDTVVIFWGTSTGIDTLGATKLTGYPGRENFGAAMFVGNIIGDRTDDLVVGTTQYPFGSFRGRVYIFEGSSSFDSTPSVVLIGDSLKSLGRVLAVGDLNNDGFNDLVARGLKAGTPRFQYVDIWYGGTSFDTLKDARVTSRETGEGLAVFDVNGDDIDDLLWTTQDSTEVDQVSIHFGGSSIDTLPSLLLKASHSATLHGNVIANGGDMNGDGFDDIIVGSFIGPSWGRVSVYGGGPSIDGEFDAKAENFTTNMFGWSASGIGDVNADGLDDIIVGAPYTTHSFLGTQPGYWGIFLGDSSILVTGVKETAIVPNVINLYQNYPNPFNPTTTISFDVPKTGFVELKVFNLLGEEVATLISGNRDAGTHTVQWDATGRPSGVYFYRLRAGEFVETRKLVLVR